MELKSSNKIDLNMLNTENTNSKSLLKNLRVWENWRNRIEPKKIGKKILLAILWLWIIFSLGYIVRDQWLKFQLTQTQDIYQQGVADTIRTLMVQTTTCQPITLQDGDKTIQIIAIACLQQAQQPQSTEQE